MCRKDTFFLFVIYICMNCSEEELIIFATSIAMELSKGLSVDELEDLRCIINQISCSISTLICTKVSAKKKK